MNYKFEKEPKTAVHHVYCLNRFVDSTKSHNVKLTRREPLAERVLNELENKLNTDVVIIVDHYSFGCHGVVLRHFSERCANFLPTGIVKVLPKKITSQAFCQAYEWMLRKEVYCPRGMLIDLLQAACYLYIPELVDKLFFWLSDRKVFTEADVIITYFQAKNKNVAKLMFPCVRRYFLPLVSTDEFREMDFDCLSELLSSNGLAVQSEVEVFYAALYWLFADYENRKHHTEDLLLTVRFSLMTSQFVLSLAGHLHEMVPHVADALMPMLKIAMLQHQMGCIPGANLEERQRNWIMDPECHYHNGDKPPQNVVGPMDFLCYLDKLDNASKFIGRIQQKKLPYL